MFVCFTKSLPEIPTWAGTPGITCAKVPFAHRGGKEWKPFRHDMTLVCSSRSSPLQIHLEALSLKGRMSGQIGPLHTIHDRNLCASRSGKLVKLRWTPRWQGVGDIASMLLCMVARQRLAHTPVTQVKAPSWLRSPARRRTHVHLLRCGGTVSANLSGCDVEGFLAEHVAREDVGDAKDGD